MSNAGNLRAYLFDTWVVFLSRDLNRTGHKHGVMQLSVSLTPDPHQVITDERGSVDALIHLVAANTVHALTCTSPTVVAWIEPESELGRRLAQAHLGESTHAALDPALHRALATDDLVRALAEDWPAEEFRPVGARLYRQLIGGLEAPRTVVHRGVRHALRTIRAGPAAKARAADLAEHVGLSESRFLHLFSEQVGVPLRAYVRWRRVFGALALILAEHRSATEAAAAMGFSDAAHLTRVMRDFLALPPSRYAKGSAHRMEIIDCTGG